MFLPWPQYQDGAPAQLTVWVRFEMCTIITESFISINFAITKHFIKVSLGVIESASSTVCVFKWLQTVFMSTEEIVSTKGH